MQEFKVGDKVICIEGYSEHGKSAILIENKIYTVSYPANYKGDTMKLKEDDSVTWWSPTRFIKATPKEFIKCQMKIFLKNDIT